MIQKHSYNRRAFQGKSQDNPLLALYCSLIDIELSLKDYFLKEWKSGHSVAQWLNEMGETSLSSQLSNKIGALVCTDRNGDRAPVVADKYPAIRYLRHQDDFTDGISTAHIQDALQIAKQIQSNLSVRFTSERSAS